MYGNFIYPFLLLYKVAKIDRLLRNPLIFAKGEDGAHIVTNRRPSLSTIPFTQIKLRFFAVGSLSSVVTTA